MVETTDILVIGGGIAGIGAAARLAGDARVIVLEQEDTIGYHSTGRSAAVFIQNYGNETLRALNAVSLPDLQQPEGISDHSLLSPRGVMSIASEEETGKLDDYLAGSTGLVELTAKEAVEQFPILRIEKICRAAIEPNASTIDVDLLLQGYARLLRSHGGRIETAANVAKISRVGTTWRIETASGSVFEAPVVVNAAGAWADVVAKYANVGTIGLTPFRRSVAILPAPDDCNVDDWCVVAPVSETWYAKPEAGKLLVSPADEDPVEPHDAWPEDMVLAEGLDRFEKATTYKVKRIEHSWAGLRSFVADRAPVVGFAPDIKGFFWLVGQGGYGVQTSPALSRLTADLVLDRSPQLPPRVIEALSPTRPGLTINQEKQHE